MTRFDRETEPEPLGEGRYRVGFDPGWFVARGPNGGYVAAVLARAVRAEVGPERPLRSLTVHYLAAPTAGERRGRRPRRALRAHDDVRLRALRAGGADRRAGARRARRRLHAGGRLPRRRDAGRRAPEAIGEPQPWTGRGGGPEFAERFDYVPAGPPPFRSAPRAQTLGWIRLKEPRPIDEAALVALADAWWPAPYMVVDRFFAAPTIDLTVHLRAPLPREHDYVLIEVRSDSARDGYFEEDVRLFHRDGTLLAHGRQLALAL